MTIQELKKLMIDDFVFSRKHNQIVRVWAVHPGYIQCYVNGIRYVNGILTEVGNDDVEPIRLTDEFLKKLGFKPRREIGWEDRDLFYWEGDRVYARLIPTSYKVSSWYDLKIESIDDDSLRRGDLRRTITRYIHELQQAFRLNSIDEELQLI